MPRPSRRVLALIVIAGLLAPAVAQANPLRVTTIVTSNQQTHGTQDRFARARRVFKILVGNPLGCVLGLVVPSLDPLEHPARRQLFKLRPVRFDSTGAGLRASLHF